MWMLDGWMDGGRMGGLLDVKKIGIWYQERRRQSEATRGAQT
jgi:hypothetical protein